MADAKVEEPKEKSATYEAGCHCGYITFAVTLSPPLPEYKVLNCNCSVCRRMGYLLVCKYAANPATPSLPTHRWIIK